MKYYLFWKNLEEKGNLVQNNLTEKLGRGSGEWRYVKGGFTETTSEIL